MSLSKEMILEIEEWIKKFPEQHKQSSVIAALTIAQSYNNGWLNRELLDSVAVYLNLPKISVYEVASFYSMFELQPVGKYKISVCTNISCMLCGSCEISRHLQKRLKINFGDITHDGKFSLKEIECISACDKAPVVEINGKQFSNMTVASIDQILVGLK